jgi:hypothetical protein
MGGVRCEIGCFQTALPTTTFMGGLKLEGTNTALIERASYYFTFNTFFSSFPPAPRLMKSGVY